MLTLNHSHVQQPIFNVIRHYVAITAPAHFLNLSDIAMCKIQRHCNVQFPENEQHQP